MPALDARGMSDMGLVRSKNEDCWLIDMNLCFAMVADGVGGGACGEIASALTVQTVASYLPSPSEELTPEQLIKEAIREANRRVIERARQEPRCKGMASTVVAAVWSLPRLIIANAGDSRAYLWRGGELTQLSHDQTMANELKHALGLSEEQMRRYPHKNVLTMAVGTGEDILVMTREEMLAPGDEVLLCSDGLSGPVGDDGIATALSEQGSLESKLEELIGAARNSGAPDNITAILLRYKA